jgi:hypothetical protein
MSDFVAGGRNWSMIGHIYDSRINKMGYDYAKKKARQTVVAAQAELIATGAVRTGNLLHSVRMDDRTRAGRYSTVTVRAGAGYALFVHDGTTGPIVSPFGNMLRVPIKKYSTWKIDRESVSGQSSNPFLVVGMNSALASARSPFGPSGLLKGFSF